MTSNHARNSTSFRLHDPNTDRPLPNNLKRSVIDTIKELFGFESNVPQVYVKKKGNPENLYVRKGNQYINVNPWPEPVYMRTLQGDLFQAASDNEVISKDMLDASCLEKSQGGCDMKAVAATPCINPIEEYDSGLYKCRSYPIGHSDRSAVFNAQLKLFLCNRSSSLDPTTIECLDNVAKNVCKTEAQAVDIKALEITGMVAGSLCLISCVGYFYRKRKARSSYTEVPDRPESAIDHRV